MTLPRDAVHEDDAVQDTPEPSPAVRAGRRRPAGTRRARTVLVLGAWALVVAVLLLQLLWSSLATGAAADRAAATLAFAAFVTLGAVVVQQRPGHRMGWLFVALGVVPGVQMAAQVYARVVRAA